MLRRLLIVVLIFLVAIVIAADRVGAIVAAHVLADKLETDEHLPNRPDTSIGGIPFLTQAFSGKYSDVSVTAHNFPVDGVRVTTLSAHLHGVHLPPGKVLHGKVSRVPVDRINGTAFVSFANIDNYLAGKSLAITVGPGSSGGVTVVDQLTVAGHTVKARGVGTAAVSGNVVTLSVAKLTAVGSAGGSSAYFSALSRVLRPINVTVPLQGLPFRISLHSVTASSSGISATGSAAKVVLGS